MILSSILALLKTIIGVIYNVFIKQTITAIENLRFQIYFRFSRIQTYRIFTSYGGYLLNTKLYVPSVGVSVAGLDRAKLGVYQFQSFLFIVVIVISILLKPTF